MRSLSDTIRRLTLMHPQAVQIQHEGQVSRLRDFEWQGANPGTLKAKAYLPIGLEGNRPLVVVLHGCTQTAAGYDRGSGWSTLADQAQFALLFPEQQRSNNPNLCFNWFQPGDTRRGAGEAQSICEMIEAFAAQHSVDHRRIFITGLSAGGAMTSAMLAAYPDVFAGGAIIAGLAAGIAQTVPQAFDRMRGHNNPTSLELQTHIRNASNHSGPWPTVSVWHGSADQTVLLGNMDLIVEQWSALHKVARAPDLIETVDGHVHEIWRNEAGQNVIETYCISGMGHGTPLATKSAPSYGTSGPFMLEAGISSTLRIAQFWDICDAMQLSSQSEDSPQSGCASQAIQPTVFASVTAGNAMAFGHETSRTVAPTNQVKVQKVIEDALRNAGLLK
ncbi:PHB depolymerase family esterase [Mesorhizobium sp. RP14(2022)]|uniref:PHB depolymerase family esterase n=1 Tax=Mesorhizobium liriopis TaxID=2953882 RepID=A0ABT1CE88_9HYPH|nr:PHB depolymerase family esterase [Mesorhizobium liriopis]MCO6052281.1 PHB depolymerase family esterase [Mesorhizobium liriopis]